MPERRRFSDAEIEASVNAMIMAINDDNSARVGDLRLILGPAYPAYRRLARRMMPEFIRWTASETNDATQWGDISAALAGMMGWMIANTARNMLAGTEGGWTRETVAKILGLTEVVAQLMAAHATDIPETELNRGKPPRTS